MSAALNPMAAAFGLGAGSSVASQASFGTYRQNQMSANTGISSMSSSTSPYMSSSSDYNTDRAEWLNRIENSHIDRNLMNRLVMNYLVTGKDLLTITILDDQGFYSQEGFKEAADKFGVETGISYPYDSESLNERIKIRNAIEIGEIELAKNLINNLHPELIDSNRYLAFHLQQQQLIELIRDKKLEEALLFAQNHLSEYCENNEKIQEELERTMALLAFENPNDSPFSDLLHLVQRQRLASEVNSAILEFENLESNAKLNTLIKMLLWGQDLLDKKSIVYPKMTDLANATIEDVNINQLINSNQ